MLLQVVCCQVVWYVVASVVVLALCCWQGLVLLVGI